MLTPPELVYRGLKGSALTGLEFDQDFRSLRDFANALAAFLGISINDDGSIKDGSVSTSAKLADRIVTSAKLHWNANLFGIAAGTDAYTLTINPSTPAITSYGDGISTTMFLIVKFTNANTTACTLAVNGLAASPIKKYGSMGGVNQLVDLAATDITAGEIHLLAFDGTSWQLMTPHPGVSATRNLFRVTVTADLVAPSGDYGPIQFNTTGADGFDVDNVWNFDEGKMVASDAGYYMLMFESMSVKSVDYKIMKNVDQQLELMYCKMLYGGPGTGLYIAKHIGLFHLDESDVIGVNFVTTYPYSDGAVYANRLWFSGYKLP